MRKPWCHRWRWLFALLVGVGAWLVVGWWLSPNLQFEAHYLVNDAINRAKVANEVNADADNDVVRQGIYWKPRIWDVTGHYLVVEEWLHSTLILLEVIDLRSGKSIAKHKCYPPELELSSLQKTANLAQTDGNIFLIKTTSGYSNTEEDRANTPFQLVRRLFNRELWQWNTVTSETKMLRKYPMKCSRSICLDGTALLEVEQVTPLLPSLLLPPSLANVLAGLSHAELETNDLAIMRTYSLPALKLRSTVTMPWIERQDNAQLSKDGRFLIVPDSATLSGFVSPTKISKEQNEQDRNRNAGSQEIYVSHPVGIRVFDNNTGRLWWESKGVNGFFPVCSTEANILRFDQPLRINSGDTGRSLMVHLPSKKSYQTENYHQLTPLDASQYQFMTLTVDKENFSYDVHTLNDQGDYSLAVRIVNPDNEYCLLPYAPQYLTITNKKPTAINIVAEWFHSHQWFLNWQPKLYSEVRVLDYQKNRTLLAISFPLDSFIPFPSSHVQAPNAMITDHHLLIMKRDEEAVHLYVYALPFPSWSPWWSRVAGLLVAVLFWRLFRVRHVQASPPRSIS